MKKVLKSLSLIILFSSVSCAGTVGLVYENEAAVLEGRAILSPLTVDGMLISAKLAMTNNATLYAGIPPGKLRKAVLLRLDNKLDIAVLQLAEEIQNADLQKAFQEKSAAISAFLPSASSDSASTLSPAAEPTFVSTEPFVIKINGNPVGSDSVELDKVGKKSGFNLEVVRTGRIPVWHVEVKLSAEPELAFWKKNKEKSLNEIPRPTFSYSYQSMFKPLESGQSMSVPVEVYFIKGDTYTFVFKIESKAGSLVKKIPVVFKSK